MTDKNNNEKATRSLTKETRKLRKTLERVNTVSVRFFLGIVSGVGTAIGATIIAAIVLYILSRVFEGTQLETFIPQNMILEPTDMQ